MGNQYPAHYFNSSTKTLIILYPQVCGKVPVTNTSILEN